MLQNCCHRCGHEGIWYGLYKSIKQMQHTVCQDNVHHHLSSKVITFRSTGVNCAYFISLSSKGNNLFRIWHHVSYRLTSQITIIFQPPVCLIVLNAHFSQSNQFPMESFVIFLLSSCTITTVFFPMPLPCHFSGNMQSCFTVLVNLYLLSDNYRLFIVFMTSSNDAIFNHSAK